MRTVLVFLYVIVGGLLLDSCTTETKPAPISPGFFIDPARVRKVQIALRNRGYYTDSVDGFLGPRTAEAIQLYQVNHSLRARPLIDRELLVSLGLEDTD